MVSSFVRFMVLLDQSSRSWIRNVEHFLIVGVLLYMEVIIMVNMIVRIVNKAVRVIVIIVILFREIRKPIFMVV